jgi:leucyl-tRNA synthetase
MELVNLMYGMDLLKERPHGNDIIRKALESMILLISPIVPHFAEELWATLGHGGGSLSATPWPDFRSDALVTDTCQMVAQVNGKLRGKFEADVNADDESLKSMALADDNVQRFIEGRTIRKIIVVKNKLVNIVV